MAEESHGSESSEGESIMFRCQVFVDPIFGSERYINFKPEWVTQVEDKLFAIPLSPWRKFPITIIHFVNGRRYMVSGYWADRINEARSRAEAGSEKE